jgi:hypothetical protein
MIFCIIPLRAFTVSPSARLPKWLTQYRRRLRRDYRHFSLIAGAFHDKMRELTAFSYSYSATGGTRTRTRLWLPIEYEYRFTEYEYEYDLIRSIPAISEKSPIIQYTCRHRSPRSFSPTDHNVNRSSARIEQFGTDSIIDASVLEKESSRVYTSP